VGSGLIAWDQGWIGREENDGAHCPRTDDMRECNGMGVELERLHLFRTADGRLLCVRRRVRPSWSNAFHFSFRSEWLLETLYHFDVTVISWGKRLNKEWG
jgi:hypothetical protein